jgi:glycerol-3-phosphate acyltransferase PlsX
MAGVPGSIDVAVDAMGGDRGPDVPVQAALHALERGVRVALVGDEQAIQDVFRRLKKSPPRELVVRHAPDVVGMDEKPSAAIRKKRGASVTVAAEMVAQGEAKAMMSAGNSGAVMAAGLFSVKRIPGVLRPALATALPTRRQKIVLLDLGANIEPTPVQLAQFAVMGEAYARVLLGRARPRVALLANGTEEGKGSDLTRGAFELLRKSKIDFIGYCEGRDIFEGQIDVIATDGFTGNVLLKTLEGFVHAAREIVESEVRSSFAASAGALLMRDILKRVKKKLDYEESGAAPLLGLRRPCLVAHGASSVNALSNAIFAANKLPASLTAAVEAGIKLHAEAGLWPPPKESDASPDGTDEAASASE